MLTCFPECLPVSVRGASLSRIRVPVTYRSVIVSVCRIRSDTSRAIQRRYRSTAMYLVLGNPNADAMRGPIATILRVKAAFEV